MTLKWQKLRIGKTVPLSELNNQNPFMKGNSEFGTVLPVLSSYWHFSGIRVLEQQNAQTVLKIIVRPQ